MKKNLEWKLIHDHNDYAWNICVTKITLKHFLLTQSFDSVISTITTVKCVTSQNASYDA